MTLGNKNLQKGKTMFLSGAKFQNFIAMATLVSAVMLGWGAEATPPDFGSKQIVKRADVIVGYERRYGMFGGYADCLAYNKGPNACAVFDVFPALHGSPSAWGTATLMLRP